MVVAGVEVGVRAGEEPSLDGVALEATGTECFELPVSSWRLCSQCRFSSTS